jgi:hypothetical protein
MRWWRALAGAVLMTISGAAGAADVAALYEATWAGMPAGEIRLSLHDDAGVYRDEIDIRSEGLPQLFTRFRAAAVSQGRSGGAMPAPADYDARYALRKSRDKRLVMKFAAREGVVIADRGPGDTSRKPPLPLRFRTNVLDPLSALSALRDNLRRGGRGPFAVPVYDGARRFDVMARVLPKNADDKNLRLRLVLSPVAGFKGEASDDGNPDDRPRPAILTMTDDDRLIPVSLHVLLDDLPLDIELKRWCDGAATCR